MSIKFVTGDWVRTDGTSRRGTVETTYADIVEVFGEPTHVNGPDSYVEWNIEFEVPDDWEEDGIKNVVATIYDHGFTTDPRRAPHDTFMFSIGGDSFESSYYVHTLLSKS